MATFNELAILIAEPLGRPLDEPFKEMLKTRMKYWRSRLLKNSLDKNPKGRPFFTQRITLKMESVSAVDCGISLNCKVQRTVAKVPKLLRSNDMLFDFVGSVDGSNPFRVVKRWEFTFFAKDRYAPLIADYVAFENDRLISVSNKLLEAVTIEAIFDDPEEVAKLQCEYEGTPCDFEDVEYPVPGEIAQQIVQMILQVDFNSRPPEADKTETNVNSNDKQ